MDLKHLRSFRVLAEELHFGRAARALGMAQPPLSRQIKELEGAIGARLFERGPRHVRLTAAGAVLYARVGALLADVDRALEETLRASRGMTGRLSLGFLHSASYAVLPAILAAYRRRFPEVVLELKEMTILDQIDALRRGRIDIGLLRPPIDHPGIAVEPLFADPFRLVVAVGHRLAQQPAAALADVQDEPFIAFPQSTSPLFHTRILAMCGAAGFVPRVAQEATHIHTVLGLVQAGLGIAIVPATGRGLSIPGIAWLPITDDPPPVAIALAWRREIGGVMVDAFRDVARNATTGLVAPAA